MPDPQYQEALVALETQLIKERDRLESDIARLETARQEAGSSRSTENAWSGNLARQLRDVDPESMYDRIAVFDRADRDYAALLNCSQQLLAGIRAGLDLVRRERRRLAALPETVEIAYAEAPDPEGNAPFSTTAPEKAQEAETAPA